MLPKQLRHRLVTFRLSSDEYESVYCACQAEGARTVSEFARASVLGRARKQDAGPQMVVNWLIAVKQELECLKQQSFEFTLELRSKGVLDGASTGGVAGQSAGNADAREAGERVSDERRNDHAPKTLAKSIGC